MPLSTNNWAGYINRDRKSLGLITTIIIECLPYRLTPLYSKIYYKEENYLKVRTAVFKYITPPYSKGSVRRYVGTLRVLMFLYFHVLSSIMWLGHLLSYSSTVSISPASYTLTINLLKSCLSTCTILFIKSVILPTYY